MSTFIPKRQKSAKSNSEPSSNGSSPPASVNLTSGSNINQVANNNNNINATNNNINNAPKFGTLVPNRVFVGGISSTTTETELCQLFSKYGNVKATKIIADRAGVSKGYGFVTFETDEEAKRLQLDADIFLKDRRLNIAPAIIKQPFPARGYEATTSPPPATNVYFHNGMPYTFHNGMAFFPQAQSQTAPLPPAPEAPVYQGTGYGPSQGPTQTFTQPMMYPCANPPPMFISPQYPQYQHVPCGVGGFMAAGAPVESPSQYQPAYLLISNQAATHIMYSSGVNPTANNGTDSSTSVPISAHPSPSFYITPGELRTEVFYNMPPATAHGCFGQVMVTSHDPSLHFCDVQTEPNNSTISAEDPQQPPTPEIHRREESPNQTETLTPYNGEWNHSLAPRPPRMNVETPIVSLLDLPNDGSNSNRGNRNNRSSQRRAQANSEQPPTNYQSGSRGYAGVNHHPGAWHQGVMSRGRGRGGRGAATFIPKFPFNSHNNNNNSTATNNNNKTSDPRMRSDIHGSERGRGGNKGFGFRGGRGGRDDQRVFIRSSSTPVLVRDSYSPIPPTFVPNLPIHSPALQVTAQHQRGAFQQSFVAANSGMQHMHAQSHAHAHTHAGYAPPGYQQPPLLQQPPQPPPPPRRFVNNNRRANANNNSQGNMRKGKCGELMDSGAAGDAPVQSLMTPPSSPGVGKGVQSSTSNVVSNEIAAQDMLCASVQNLSVN